MLVMYLFACKDTLACRVEELGDLITNKIHHLVFYSQTKTKCKSILFMKSQFPFIQMHLPSPHFIIYPITTADVTLRVKATKDMLDHYILTRVITVHFVH